MNVKVNGHKIFYFTKKLFRYLLFAATALLACVVVVAKFGGFKTSVVLTASMSPTINAGDLLVVKKQQSYKIGDVVQFNFVGDAGVLNLTHRVVGSVQGKFYVCCGDATAGNWQNIANKVKDMSVQEILNNPNLQLVQQSSITGRVVTNFGKLGKVFVFAQNNMLVVVAVLIWHFLLFCRR